MAVYLDGRRCGAAAVALGDDEGEGVHAKGETSRLDGRGGGVGAAGHDQASHLLGAGAARGRYGAVSGVGERDGVLVRWS